MGLGGVTPGTVSFPLSVITLLEALASPVGSGKLSNRDESERRERKEEENRWLMRHVTGQHQPNR